MNDQLAAIVHSNGHFGRDEGSNAVYFFLFFLDIMFGHSGPDVDSEYLYFLKSGLTMQIVYNVKIMDNNGHSVNKVLTVLATFQKINLPQVGGFDIVEPDAQ